MTPLTATDPLHEFMLAPVVQPAGQREFDVAFFIPGDPVPWGRAGLRTAVTRTGKVIAKMYTPAKTAAYERNVAAFAKHAMKRLPPSARPLFFAATVVIKPPGSWSLVKQAAAIEAKIAPSVKPDLDNILKALYDGMNGVVWTDDAQIVTTFARKMYGRVPGVYVRVVATGQATGEDPRPVSKKVPERRNNETGTVSKLNPPLKGKTS